jgi:acetyl-CoA acyltransferase
MRDAVIVEAVRTPVAKGKSSGAYASIHPIDLHAQALRTAVERLGLDPGDVDDVIGGVVGQVGEQSNNSTRSAVLAAGFPESVPAVTVDRQCGSSQQAISFAAQGVISGGYDIAIASGVESMSRVPIGSSALVNGEHVDVSGEGIRTRYPEGLANQGIGAELIARKWGLSRVQLEEFSLASHQKAAAAWREGRFDREVAPLSQAPLAIDETIRPDTTLEQLAALQPAFAKQHWADRFGFDEFRITAGTSSPVNDGSAAVVITTSDIAAARGWKPLARVHTAVVAGDDPLMMLMGILPATEKALAKAGLRISDIDAFEVNEAFASVVLSWIAETGADPAKVNVNGGAIAIGHPLGASGARLATTLLGVLEQTGGRFGLQTMCEGGGTANATIYERL